MDKELAQQDLIDRYLKGDMNSSERNDFEKLIKEDYEIRETIELQKLILEEIKQKESFDKIIKEGEKPTIPLFKVLSFSMAAVIIGILIWQPWFLSNDKIFNSYMTILEIKDPREISYTSSDLRGEECEYQNLTNDECVDVRIAIRHYEIGNFENASKIFESVLNPVRKNYELSLYMAISQLKSGKVDQCITTLNEISNSRNDSIKETANYYLALSYIHLGDLSTAKSILKSLINNKGEYSDRSNQILKKMRWF